MKRNLHLLVIDPQNDFCDLSAAYLPLNPVDGVPYSPALPVAGAHADMQRIAGLIAQGRDGLEGISVTLDSHHRIDIAHPPFWMLRDGGTVSPFTQISAAEVREGKYLPRDRTGLPRVLAYLETLEQSGRYRHMVWPVHCEIGSWGHNVHADVRAAYNEWEEARNRSVNIVSKGNNPWTEHYSAIMAEVPDATDPDTQLNAPLIALLAQADRVFICGEAGSHCVKATTEHIADNIGAENLSKLVLLTDCMSAVTGFEDQQQSFLKDMQARGLQLATADEVQPELLANAL
jgi:nicotinamidase/pyrazinamidase